MTNVVGFSFMVRISVNDDSEFTLFIADLIETLAQTEKFVLKIWINGSELPFEFDNACSFYFMQEGFRVDTGEFIDYIFYDNIVSLRLMYES